MTTENLYKKFKECTTVSTDTRKIEFQSIFFALRGDRYNANTFAEDALQKGARYAVIDDPKYAKDERYIVVENTLVALQQLAGHHRKQLHIPVIGLTGSNGKTTSKELLHAVLSKKFKTFATQGNLNNHIGVPLSILSIDSTIAIAVIEMGANHVGEIAQLCAIANPTHGFITNIGKAHVGTFGGFENIVRGKSELYQHIIDTNGTVFINSQNLILMNMAKRFASPVFYPQHGDYYHCEPAGADPFLKIKTENGETVTTHLAGAYNFENIAIALCIGKFFGVSSDKANQAVAEYVPENMRSQWVKKNNNTVLLDAYNANPTSMQAAIEALADLDAGKKAVILGDMYELEETAEKEHRAIGKLVAAKKFDAVYLCGELMAAAAKEIPLAKYFLQKETLLHTLKQDALKGYTVLVKASRGMRLEDVAEFL